MLNPDQRPKITIEDLLRLKQAERPPAEFWTTFERELRQKQLSALLEKRSWWHDLPQLLTRRVYLPVGATAVLAFTFVSLQYYSPVKMVQVGESPAAPAVAQTNAGSQVANPVPVEQASSTLTNRNSQQVSRDVGTTGFIADAPIESVEPVKIAPVTNSPDLSDSPSARSIAANVAHMEQSEPDLMNAVLGNRLSSPARVQPESGPVVELASLSINGSGKRSRLLASYNDRQVSPEPTAPDIVRERLSRRLGDADYSDRFSRIGLKGSQVSLKF